MASHEVFHFDEFTLDLQERRLLRGAEAVHLESAIQERYKFLGFLSVSIASLQGIAERPLPCNYDVLGLFAP
jgi:hypothetical protein